MIKSMHHLNFVGYLQGINMQANYKYLILMLVLSCSCDNNVSTNNKPEEFGNHFVSKYDTIQLTDDKYLSDILAWNDPYKRLLKDRKRESKYTLVNNEYDANIIDTVITYTTPNTDTFTYYTSGDTAAAAPALVKFDINSSSIILPLGVHTAIIKANFYRPLPVDKPNLVVAVSEQEGYQNLYFTFKNDTLKRIQFESFYLD